MTDVNQQDVKSGALSLVNQAILWLQSIGECELNLVGITDELILSGGVYREGFSGGVHKHQWLYVHPFKIHGENGVFLKLSSWKDPNFGGTISFPECSKAQWGQGEEAFNAEKLKRGVQAIEESRKIWNEAVAIYEIPEYLRIKGFSVFDLSQINIRQDKDCPHTFYIPLYKWKQALRVTEATPVDGLQVIQADGKTSDGKKWFIPGLDCSELLGVVGGMNVPSHGRVLVAEGFATGLSCYLATQLPTVISLGSGRLPKVTEYLKYLSHSLRIVICADNDDSGVAAATEGSLGIANIALCPTKGQDFNDYMQTDGNQKVKDSILSAFNSEPPYLIPLGTLESGEQMIVSSYSSQIHLLAESTLKTTQMVSKEYLKRLYSKSEYEIDWLNFRWDLSDQCHKKPRIDSDRIRGVGVWVEPDSIVFNRGNSLDQLLYKTGKLTQATTALFESKSNQVYESKSKTIKRKIEPKDGFIAEALWELINTLRMDHWDKMKMIGWLTSSLVSGAMPWRSHLWVTGGKGSGKSTVKEQIFDTLFKAGLGCYNVGKGTSEAAIRQLMQRDSLPLIYDEFFDFSGQKEDGSRSQVMGLLRNCTDGTPVVKGSAGGKAQTFAARFPACILGIDVKLDNHADQSRFIVVEIEAPKPKETPENISKQWQQFVAASACFDELANETAWQLMFQAEKIIKTRGKAVEILMEGGLSAREADCESYWLAGVAVARCKDLRTIINEYLLSKVLKKQEEDRHSELHGLEDFEIPLEQRDEGGKILSMLLNKLVSMDEAGRQIRITVKELYMMSREKPDDVSLERNGMKYLKDKDGTFGLFIHPANPEFKKLISDQNFAVYGLTGILTRIAGVKQTTTKVLHQTVKGIFVPEQILGLTITPRVNENPRIEI